MEATELDERVELAPMRRHPAQGGNGLIGYVFDLTAHEQRRLAAVYAGRLDFDPAAALADEAEAHRGCTAASTPSSGPPTSFSSTRGFSSRKRSMRDPQADDCRRAWTECPACGDQRGCGRCENGRACEVHWRLLLSAQGRRLFVQCRGCWHRWWHDTGFGSADRRPACVDDVPDFPPSGGRAAA